jgi:hypothetical protein
MPTVCSNLARGKRARFTLLDECGAVVEGPTSTLVTTGFVSVTWTPNYLEAEEITQADADGALCVDDRSDPALRWIDLSIILCVVDPDMVNLITGDPLVVDDAVAPNTVGFRINAGLTGTANFALELWSGVTGQACSPEGFPAYGYWLFPWVKDAQWGETVVQNGALTLTFTARAVFDSQWGVGPYDVRRDAVVPATLEPLLTPIDDEDVMHYEVTTAPLPAAGCGAIELDTTP